MTTGILDALMRLFALFASGRSAREAMLGRQAASRYLLGRLSRAVTEDYLKRYDAALEKLNRKMPQASAPKAADGAAASACLDKREREPLVDKASAPKPAGAPASAGAGPAPASAGRPVDRERLAEDAPDDPRVESRSHHLVHAFVLAPWVMSLPGPE